METYQKQAWELVTGEYVMINDRVFKVRHHQRSVRPRIGAAVGLRLMEHGRAVYMVIDMRPFDVVTCVSQPSFPVSDTEKLDRLRALLDEKDENGVTNWQWIDGGLGGDLYEKMREILG